MNLLFVVHRAYPYPGGSEAFVHWMAVECLRRGHHVGILADTNQGDCAGILITANRQITDMQDWDLIIVHGADCVTQDFIHRQGPLNSNIPVLYQIIQPSSSPTALQGMDRAKFIGVSTVADQDHVYRYRHQSKMRVIPHGIPEDRLGRPGFKKAHGITGKMVMSAGGFWPHKGMNSLADRFRQSGNTDSTLCLFGYDKFDLAPEQTDRVKIFQGLSDPELLDALSEADLYVMNSRIEGFGLVLLEAMLNKVPWVSRAVGGAPDMRDYGRVMDSTPNLDLLEMFGDPRRNEKDLENTKQRSFDYVKTHHLIYNTVDGIEKVLGELV
jgi:glycosyltransferase involved in cell wall biosynthesis